MARGNSRSSRMSQGQRDVSSITNLRLLTRPIFNFSFLKSLEDSRRYYPEVRPVGVTMRGTPARVAVSRSRPWQMMRFVAPQRVVVCVRRRVRKEVMHALGIAGRRGGAGAARRRFTQNSHIHC